MGYTHYWFKKAKLDDKKFKSFSEKVKVLLAGENVVWEYNDPTKAPEVTNEMVRFNGIGVGGHETFLFERCVKKDEFTRIEDGKAFSFCKTARNPYDELVTACLILAKITFGGDINISSDGSVGEWQPGINILKTKLNLDVKMNGEEVGSAEITATEPIKPVEKNGFAILFGSASRKIVMGWTKSETGMQPLAAKNINEILVIEKTREEIESDLAKLNEGNATEYKYEIIPSSEAKAFCKE